MALGLAHESQTVEANHAIRGKKELRPRALAERGDMSGLSAHVRQKHVAAPSRTYEPQPRGHAGPGSVRRAVVEDRTMRDARPHDGAAGKE